MYSINLWSEDKDADKLCSYCTADLRLCFRYMHVVGYPKISCSSIN